MNIYTSERYEDGLHLISTEGFTGLANMTFLSKEATIKEYEKWYNSHINNVIPLSDISMPPQIIHISSITAIDNVNELAQDELDKSDLTEEDVLIPFIGGVQGYNLQDLMNKLWDVEEKKHFRYLLAIRNYYKELFK